MFRLGNKISIEERKSRVRVLVTIWAALYVFGGSTLLIAALWIEKLDTDSYQIAKDIFMTVLPVAAGIITYWFASRPKSGESQDKGNPDKQEDKGQGVDNSNKVNDIHKGE